MVQYLRNFRQKNNSIFSSYDEILDDTFHESRYFQNKYESSPDNILVVQKRTWKEGDEYNDLHLNVIVFNDISLYCPMK